MRAQHLAAQLRSDISDARFAPGDQLQEVHIAQRYDVSRNTLREAFAMLAAHNLVERIPNRGVFIATPDRASARDLYAARAALEPAAILWGEHLDVETLTATTERARELALADDPESLRTVGSVNQDFHRLIVAGMGSPFLDKTMDNLLAQMRLCFLAVLKEEPAFHSHYATFNAHLSELIAHGERATAAEELRRSLAETCEHICDVLPR